MSISFDKMLAFVAEKHARQKDKGGNSYLLHILRVALKVFEITGSEDAAIVGLGHDVLEDTSATEQDLIDLGLTEAQINAIKDLTKPTNKEKYDRETYINGILRSSVARVVKICDIEDNMALWRIKNRNNLTDKDFQRYADYAWMYSRLKGI